MSTIDVQGTHALCPLGSVLIFPRPLLIDILHRWDPLSRVLLTAALELGAIDVQGSERTRVSCPLGSVLIFPRPLLIDSYTEK